MKLYAISDLHLDFKINHDAVSAISEYPQDWLILAGDICTSFEDFQFALNLLSDRFSRLLWVPGNHDLWSGIGGIQERGEEKYEKLVSICHEFDVITPEDPYPIWAGEGGIHYIVPLFLLYDYSFRPDHISCGEAVDWAKESGIVCTDEYLLDPAPKPSLSAWCHARCKNAATRLGEISDCIPSILINHFPLRSDLARLPRAPRFSIWCGTRITESWHLRYKASVVISGHLHIRGTSYRDAVRFEEVSLGYPRNWDQRLGIQNYLRQILPLPDSA